MRTFPVALLLGMGILACAAQEGRYFRVAGPVPVTITDISADGHVTWTNTATDATFIVQTATALGGEGDWVDWVQIPVTNATSVSTHLLFDLNPPSGMALIPAGSFTMGDSLDGTSSALPLHTVYVSAFYMDRYEVTYALWQQVYDWGIAHGYSFEYGALGKSATHPAQSMTWYDAVKWCNARSEKEGLTPAYYTTSAQTTVYRTGQVNEDNTSVKWNVGYRLPTEAEWEKAARGGVSGQRFPWGNTITHSQANYYSSTNYAYDVSPTRGYHPTFSGPPCTGPVGYFAPNGYGLYDMAGNVSEWCWDSYVSFYESASQTDPRGPPGSGSSYRMYRSGSWTEKAFYCRAAYRHHYFPHGSTDTIGFRCARAAGQ